MVPRRSADDHHAESASTDDHHDNESADADDHDHDGQGLSAAARHGCAGPARRVRFTAAVTTCGYEEQPGHQLGQGRRQRGIGFTYQGQGTYDWTQYDQLVADIQNAGLSIDFLLDGNPQWEGNGSMDAPLNPRCLMRRARAVAQRYGSGGPSEYEIANEPNITEFWTTPNAAAYTAVLKAAFTSDPIGTALGCRHLGWSRPHEHRQQRRHQRRDLLAEHVRRRSQELHDRGRLPPVQLRGPSGFVRVVVGVLPAQRHLSVDQIGHDGQRTRANRSG